MAAMTDHDALRRAIEAATLRGDVEAVDHLFAFARVPTEASDFYRGARALAGYVRARDVSSPSDGPSVLSFTESQWRAISQRAALLAEVELAFAQSVRVEITDGQGTVVGRGVEVQNSLEIQRIEPA